MSFSGIEPIGRVNPETTPSEGDGQEAKLNGRGAKIICLDDPNSLNSFKSNKLNEITQHEELINRTERSHLFLKAICIAFLVVGFFFIVLTPLTLGVPIFLGSAILSLGGLAYLYWSNLNLNKYHIKSFDLADNYARIENLQEKMKTQEFVEFITTRTKERNFTINKIFGIFRKYNVKKQYEREVEDTEKALSQAKRRLNDISSEPDPTTIRT